MAESSEELSLILDSNETVELLSQSIIAHCQTIHYLKLVLTYDAKVADLETFGWLVEYGNLGCFCLTVEHVENYRNTGCPLNYLTLEVVDHLLQKALSNNKIGMVVATGCALALPELKALLTRKAYVRLDYCYFRFKVEDSPFQKKILSAIKSNSDLACLSFVQTFPRPLQIRILGALLRSHNLRGVAMSLTSVTLAQALHDLMVGLSQRDFSFTLELDASLLTTPIARLVLSACEKTNLKVTLKLIRCRWRSMTRQSTEALEDSFFERLLSCWAVETLMMVPHEDMRKSRVEKWVARHQKRKLTPVQTHKKGLAGTPSKESFLI